MTLPRFTRGPDPIIETLSREYGIKENVRTQDVREALRFAPYKSVAPEVLNHKKQTDEFIRKEPDATKITRSSLQNKLHGLELQRLELQKQTDEKKLGHMEGNIRLRELGAMIADVTAKLNAIEAEQAEFNKHLHDLRDKNDELSSKLRSMKGEEAITEKKMNRLAEEKAELARKLAEVTQDHTRQQKLLAEQAARRLSVEDALAHMRHDADLFASQLRELAESRRSLEKELKRLKFDEIEAEKNIGRYDEEYSSKMTALTQLLSGIEKLQNQIQGSMPVLPSKPDQRSVPPVPLAHIPPTQIPSEPLKRLRVKPDSSLSDYKPSNAVPGLIDVPVVSRGLYEESLARCIPEPVAPVLHRDDTYYSCETTAEMMKSRRQKTPTTDRTRYVGLSTYNAGARQNMGTGLARPGTGNRPFTSTEVPQSHDTTYGHFFGREGVSSGSGLRASQRD